MPEANLNPEAVAQSPSALPSRRLGATLAAAFLGWMFDGMEMGIFPIVARPALQHMQTVQGILDEGFVQRWMGIVTALFLLGAAFGGVIFGWLGDRFGRVRAMTWSILFYSVFTGLCYFATAPWHLAALRFIAALGMGGEWALGVALVMESWPEKKRPLMAGLIGVSANLGYAIIALIAISVDVTRDSWRWVMMVGALPAALTFLIRLFVPESEKWKASVRKVVQSNPIREVFSPALIRNTILAIVFSSVALIVTWGIVQWLPLWADQMTGGKMPKVKAYVQMASALGACVGCIIAPLVGGRFGRRPVYFALCLVSMVVCEILFNGFHSYSFRFLILVFSVGLFTAAFYGWLPLYLPELFPTRVRATGQGLSYNFGRILAAFGAWHMSSLMGFFDKSYSKAGATIVLIYIVGMIMIWFAPETRDRPLPD
jgi:SHS family sialic acid transporter-like MFS transporter